MKDYYKVLAVPRNATTAQIKDAYRRLIKACHPDVNSSPRAAEWTRELNEAYGTLEDAQARVTYDLNLKPERPRKRETDGRQASRSQTSGNKTRTRTGPADEPRYRCGRCCRKDATLRVSTFWRVFSFIVDSWQFPTREVLCHKCRVQESLAASAFTVIFGWWNLKGFFGSLEALGKNAGGGSQNKAENVAYLKAFGDQLYRAKRFQEAYQVLAAAFKLQPEPSIGVTLNRLSHQIKPVKQQPFWNQLWSLELDPRFYHMSAGAIVVALLILGFSPSRAGSLSNRERPQAATHGLPAVPP